MLPVCSDHGAASLGIRSQRTGCYFITSGYLNSFHEGRDLEGPNKALARIIPLENERIMERAQSTDVRIDRQAFGPRWPVLDRDEPTKTLHSKTADHVAARKGFEAAFHRACRWRVPPSWTTRDWKMELRSIALIAAWQAQLVYSGAFGGTMQLFVQGRTLARLLTRYRQEWRLALREVHVAQDGPSMSAPEPGEGTSREEHLKTMEEALLELPANERWLIEQVFWHDRSQEEIGAELGISQPAVHKRKQVALDHLRQRFGDRLQGEGL